ncbi:hypothetical protein SAMN02745166_02147 [Prosthecobacter debontii]|uniref:Uncharacterized protein n=1 Tax=Prosthecobacter debontii TaxID=48467 RepID=A0A1T4XZ69_9BACT|nr:hypothetical protein SAMN02745166_02147 [Prosthecobacter debontii]
MKHIRGRISTRKLGHSLLNRLRSDKGAWGMLGSMDAWIRKRETPPPEFLAYRQFIHSSNNPPRPVTPRSP